MALAQLDREHGLSFARVDVVVEQADPDEGNQDVLVATASSCWSPLQGAG
ncbi:MAG: hypothetical protein IPG45_37590 [Deltaproteobacteria bacterium]|nr:hypothetical protein [Deltaproteobacteria bacterium]